MKHNSVNETMRAAWEEQIFVVITLRLLLHFLGIYEEICRFIIISIPYELKWCWYLISKFLKIEYRWKDENLRGNSNLINAHLREKSDGFTKEKETLNYLFSAVDHSCHCFLTYLLIAHEMPYQFSLRQIIMYLRGGRTLVPIYQYWAPYFFSIEKKRSNCFICYVVFVSNMAL